MFGCIATWCAASRFFNYCGTTPRCRRGVNREQFGNIGRGRLWLSKWVVASTLNMFVCGGELRKLLARGFRLNGALKARYDRRSNVCKPIIKKSKQAVCSNGTSIMRKRLVVGALLLQVGVWGREGYGRGRNHREVCRTNLSAKIRQSLKHRCLSVKLIFEYLLEVCRLSLQLQNMAN